MAKKIILPIDANANAVQCLKLSSPQDIDGTGTHAVSAAIQGELVRIVAIDGDIRFLIGTAPEALATSHFLGDHQEIWMPIEIGEKVSVLGGPAHIATAGE